MSVDAMDYDVKVDSERLKKIRKLSHMTQTEVAEKMGISMASYQAKESGDTKFKEREKFMLRQLFNLSFEEFDEILYGGLLRKIV